MERMVTLPRPAPSAGERFAAAHAACHDTVYRHLARRVVRRDGACGQGGDSRFIRDTGATRDADFTGFPTGTNGTCGELFGEVVLHPAVAKWLRACPS